MGWHGEGSMLLIHTAIFKHDVYLLGLGAHCHEFRDLSGILAMMSRFCGDMMSENETITFSWSRELYVVYINVL